MLRIYADTSVFGGCCDEEFAAPSRTFLRMVEQGLFSLIVSPVVNAEIRHSATPKPVQDVYSRLLPIAEIVSITPEAVKLQAAYIKQGIIGPQWENDALHVAIATVTRCDLIVSWNFKHIVNFRKIPLYNAVNILHGYPELHIYSPLEVIQHEE
jgi:predicted nucleic acid-binding protein